MRTLVVLGAADGALSTYRIAAELGYRTIAVDWSPAAPGVGLADEYLPLSTRDAGAILAALAGRTDVVGVLSPCSDIAVPTVRALTIGLGLPVGLSELAARASVDKWVVRGILDELGVSSYGWVVGDDPADIAERARQLRFPVVVKPADAQGGRGVFRCADPDDVAGFAAAARRRSYGGQVMVEEEIPGRHGSCECVVDDGRVVFMATTRQTLSPPPLALTLRHQVPAGLSSEVEDTCGSIVDKLCARLEYRRGPVNLDLVVTPDGEPYVIELGLRTGGNGMDELVRAGHGVDPVRAAVQAAVGQPIELAPRPPRPALWQVLGAEEAGELRSISGEEPARAVPGLTELMLMARPGQPVRPYQEVSDRLGWFVLTADTVEGLTAAADAVTRTLRFDVVTRG